MQVSLAVPPDVVVYQAYCPDCGGNYALMIASGMDRPHPIYCVFCARRLPWRPAHMVYPEDALPS